MPERVLPAKTPEKTVEMPAQRPADLSAVLDRIFEVVLRLQAILLEGTAFQAHFFHYIYYILYIVYSWTTAHRRLLVFDCLLAFSARFKRCRGLWVWCGGGLNARVPSNVHEACNVVQAGLCVMLARV